RSGGPAPEPSFPRLQPALDFADQVEGTAETDPVTRTPEPVSQAKRLEGVARGPYPVGETPGGACDGRRILGPGTALPGPGRDQTVGQGQQSLQHGVEFLAGQATEDQEEGRLARATAAGPGAGRPRRAKEGRKGSRQL